MKVRALSEASAAWRGGYMIADVLMDAALDSVKMLPFLLAAFLLMEWLEKYSGEYMNRLLADRKSTRLNSSH